MKLHVSAIGKLKNGPEQALAADYFERAGQLGRQTGITALAVTEHAESQARASELRKADEAARLLGSCSAIAFVVALDERGKNMSSVELADELRKLIDNAETAPPIRRCCLRRLRSSRLPSYSPKRAPGKTGFGTSSSR